MFGLNQFAYAGEPNVSGKPAVSMLSARKNKNHRGYSEAQEVLLALLQKDGQRKAVRVGERSDLQGLIHEIQDYSDELGFGCEFEKIFEIRLTRDGIEAIAGYEARLHCEDAPSPALSLYFDVNKRYLGALDPVEGR